MASFIGILLVCCCILAEGLACGGSISQCDFLNRICVVCSNSEYSLQTLLSGTCVSWTGFTFYLHPFVYDCPSFVLAGPTRYNGTNATQPYAHRVCSNITASIGVASVFTNVPVRIGMCVPGQEAFRINASRFSAQNVFFYGDSAQPFVTVASKLNDTLISFVNVTASFLLFDPVGLTAARLEAVVGSIVTADASRYAWDEASEVIVYDGNNASSGVVLPWLKYTLLYNTAVSIPCTRAKRVSCSVPWTIVCGFIVVIIAMGMLTHYHRTRARSEADEIVKKND